MSFIQLRDTDINDTMIVEYLCNAPKSCSELWCKALDYCQLALETLVKENRSNKDMEHRRHSIIFQGVVEDGISLDTLDTNWLVSEFKLGQYHLKKSHPTPGGRLWLLQTPILTDSGSHEARYLALSTKTGENEQNEYLFDNSFNWPDLIAHKAHQIAAVYRYILLEKTLKD